MHIISTTNMILLNNFELEDIDQVIDFAISDDETFISFMLTDSVWCIYRVSD